MSSSFFVYIYDYLYFMIDYDNRTFSRDKTLQCYVVSFIHEQILLYDTKTEIVLKLNLIELF